MAKKLLPYLLIFIICIMQGCAYVCRHEAMMNAAVIYENGHEPEFVLYTTNPIISLGIYNAHVQATYKVNNKRIWLGANAQESEESAYPMGEYCWILNMHQYIDWLKVNRELNKKPLPSKEYRDKHWPKTVEVMK